jgi:hypothetical protein
MRRRNFLGTLAIALVTGIASVTSITSADTRSSSDELPDVEVPDGPDGISDRKVLVIGADGVRPDTLAQATTPTLMR